LSAVRFLLYTVMLAPVRQLQLGPPLCFWG